MKERECAWKGGVRERGGEGRKTLAVAAVGWREGIEKLREGESENERQKGGRARERKRRRKEGGRVGGGGRERDLGCAIGCACERGGLLACRVK